MISLPAASSGSISPVKMTLFLSGHLQSLHISPFCCVSFLSRFFILQESSIKLSDLLRWQQLPFGVGFFGLGVIFWEQENLSCVEDVPGFNKDSLVLER